MYYNNTQIIVHYRSGLLFDCSFFPNHRSQWNRSAWRMRNFWCMGPSIWSTGRTFCFFVFLKRCEYPMVLSVSEIPADLLILLAITALINLFSTVPGCLLLNTCMMCSCTVQLCNMLLATINNKLWPLIKNRLQRRVSRNDRIFTKN